MRTISYRISSNSSPGDYNFEGNFAREYFVIFEKINTFGESDYSSRSVMGVMHYFDIKIYTSS